MTDAEQEPFFDALDVVRAQFSDASLEREVLTLAKEKLTEAANRLTQLTAQIAELKAALVEHNDRLRSAVAIAHREGADTNWLSFRGQCHYTLAEYHDLVNEARHTLEAHNGTD